MVKPVSEDAGGSNDRPAGSYAESSHDAIIGVTQQGIINSWNPAAERLYGYAAAEIVGSSVEVLYPPERRAEEAEILSATLLGKEVVRFLTDRVHKDGTVIQVSLTASPIMDDTGTIVGTVGVSRKVSRLRDAWDRFEERVAAERAEAQDAQDRFEERVAAERAEARDAQDQFEKRVTADRAEAQDGRDRFDERVRAERAAARDAEDQFEEQQGTDRLEADRRKARQQAQLHQAQRLETLGQLAGGVAHDFNNLVAVILNYASFVSEEMSAATQSDWAQRYEAARADVGQIQQAAERAAALTRQLLAFARREVVRPRALDLNDVIHGVEEMLRRTIGEHVELVTSLDEGLWPVLADPGQIETALVNLAVNARDAMPDGGTLTIDTSNATVDAALSPGDHRPGKGATSGFGSATPAAACPPRSPSTPSSRSSPPRPMAPGPASAWPPSTASSPRPTATSGSTPNPGPGPPSA